jgi:hypothetical protein
LVLGNNLAETCLHFALRLRSLSTQPSLQNPITCGSPRELNLVLTLFPGCWSGAMLLEGKEMRTFISTNGGKMGFSGDMGDWVGVSC